MRRSGIIAGTLLVLAGCTSQANKADNAEAASPAPAVRNAVVATPAPAPAAPAALAPDICPPAPTLVFPADFPDPHHDFAPGKMGRQLTETSFTEAYAMACRAGVVRGHRIGEGAADPSQLVMRNAPEANMVSIYVESADNADPAGRRAVLEFRAFDGNGHYLWPMVSEINEAIYCHVHGATPHEQEESGRCLVD